MTITITREGWREKRDEKTTVKRERRMREGNGERENTEAHTDLTLKRERESGREREGRTHGTG